MCALLYLCRITEPYIDRKDDSFQPDGEFKANLKNSVLFIYQWFLQSCVIFVNYQGRPFMISLRENSKLFYMLCFMFFVVFSAVTDQSDELRETLQLTKLPNEEFQFELGKTLILDFVLCNSIEMIVRKVYLGANGYSVWGYAY